HVLDPPQRVDRVDRDEVVRERPLPLPGADDEVGAAGDGPGAAGEGADGVLDRRGGDERAAHRSAPQTRSGVIGRRSTGRPTSFAIALPIAPAVGTHGGSPMPFEPFGPAFGVGVSTQAIWIRGASEAVTSL